MDETPARTRGRAALGPLLLLVVPVSIAWARPSLLPGFDPEPWTTAAGWSAIGTLAATALLAGRTARVPRRARWLAAPGIAALASSTLGAGSEPLESSRALLTLAAGLSAWLAAATLDPRERSWLARGLVLATLALGLPLLAAGSDLVTLAGPLGNTGYANQVLLPGGAAGAALLVLGRGPWRAAGAAAALVAALHAALSPTLLGLLAMAGALAVAALGPRPPAVRARLGLCAAAVAALLIATAASGSDDRSAPTTQEAPAMAASGELGGIAARLSVWRATVSLATQAGAFGLGPGRFRAEFPRYRESRERRASELGGVDARTEVEHPHNDWLLPWVEAGWIGGLLWTAFLGAGLAFALRASTGGTATDATLAVAGLAVLVNAGAHASLSINAPAAMLAMAALGAAAGSVGGAPEGEPAGRDLLGRGAARLLALIPVALAVLAPLAPWRLVQRGDALSEHLELTARLAAGAEPDLESLVARRAALERLLAVGERGDPLALMLAIAEARRDRAPSAELGYLEDLERLRPRSASTLEARGLWAVDRGDRGSAAASFEALLMLRPGDATATMNLARLRLEEGRGDLALELLDVHGLDAERRLALARDAQLEGWVDPEVVVELLDGAVQDRSPDGLFNAAELLRQRDEAPATRAALESLAHHLWAREHARSEQMPTAARVYRQAWRASRDGGDGSPLIRLELAAAERLGGDESRAQALIEGFDGPAPPALPDWARTALTPR
jgi:O-antigen ligase